MRFTSAVALLVLVAGLAVPGPASGAASRWEPVAQLDWQVQFSGRIDLSVDADVYDLDAFDTPRRTVTRLHRSGRRAVCYINAGSWEGWRPDAGRFRDAVLGRPLDGWPGERWLDIRRLDLLAPILRDRLAMCRAKGFDGVEFDNVNGYTNRTGFRLTAADQLAFNRWLARTAHEHGLAAGLKNTLELARELEPDFDFLLLEQCFAYRECALGQPFLAAGKPVLDIEYDIPRSRFCAAARELGMGAMRKRLNLDAWRRPC